MLLLWLHQMYDTKKHGPPTWEMLVEAVSKDIGGNNKALAKKLRRKELQATCKMTENLVYKNV